MGRLQTARLENFIRRWGSIKGPGSVLSETLGDVFPVLDLENLTPENQLVAGWTPFFGFLTVVAVAAQQQGVSLVNPAGSGNLVVCDRATVSTNFTGTVTVGNSLALFPLAAGTTSRDTRNPGPVGGVRIGGNSNTGASETGAIVQVVSAADQEIDLPNGTAVLAPGTQLAVVNTSANQNITVSFYGRVRVAEPSELSF